MRLDFSKIEGMIDEQAMITEMKNQIEAAPIDDQPFLSDVLSWHDNRKTAALLALHEVNEEDGNTRRWRIKVRCREFGEKPVPGETVDYVIDINRVRRDGKLTQPGEINAAKINGSYSKRFEKRRSYEIDEKGCILCPMNDAISFLRDYGVHSVTGYSLPHGKPETSTEPARKPDGTMRLIHYWRYEEVDDAQYKKLPVLKKSKEQTN